MHFYFTVKNEFAIQPPIYHLANIFNNGNTATAYSVAAEQLHAQGFSKSCYIAVPFFQPS